MDSRGDRISALTKMVYVGIYSESPNYFFLNYFSQQKYSRWAS